MHKQIQIFLLVLSGFLFFACTKPAPQLPANKNNGSRDLAGDLRKMHEEISEHEDSLLAVYINKSDSTFQKSALGFWYKINKKTAGSLIKHNDKCKISYSIYSLSGEFLGEKLAIIQIGKKETLRGIEEVLKKMRSGEQVSLILPSALAYGMKGDGDKIRAYTSLKIYLEVDLLN
ncbi:MAG: FKBP-type peptidyl-prolyl cis-trans isomerase [Paludibacter sp.]|nr:FKBP-type peptidyl-prolyl cis-trans isomerase [Paludibacter sp.]